MASSSLSQNSCLSTSVTTYQILISMCFTCFQYSLVLSPNSKYVASYCHGMQCDFGDLVEDHHSLIQFMPESGYFINLHLVVVNQDCRSVFMELLLVGLD